MRYAAAQSLGPAVKRLIRTAKKRGYVTHDQINSVLPSDGANSEQIEDIAMFSKMGVNVVQTEEASESEIAIAKRIEAGREAMIAGLCESLLTFQAIIIWRDELNEEKVFLRDIIDLEATYAGPDAKPMPTTVIGPDGQLIPALPLVPGAAVPTQTQVPPATSTGAASFKATLSPASSEKEGELGESAQNDDEFDDDAENSLSLAAIEAELTPKVLETFDNVADAYKRLRRLQDQDIEFKLKNTTLSPAQERRYKKLKNDIITEVKKYWRAIKVPILVLRGVDSDLLPADLARDMVRRNPSARVLEIEGCGHAPSLMSHEQIERVCEFLRVH